MCREYGWEDKLAFSRGIAENTHPDTIRKFIGESCVSIVEPTIELNKAGIDFVATLRRGADINIDLKTRIQGCKKYWKNGPEFSLETWSVVPNDKTKGKAGWTLDESKLTDYTLHVFDKSDTEEAFLIPFQLLRMAFRKNVLEWKSKFRTAIQDTDGKWKSECVFVPASLVIESITAEMRTSV